MDVFYRTYTLRRAIFSLLKPAQFQKWKKMRSVRTKEGFSLEPFDKHHCIFIHIPKSAGVSVSNSLFGGWTGGHTKMKAYTVIFNRKEFESYFKFTFVRNPWDRLFSAYNFLKKGGMFEEDRHWAKENIDVFSDFQQFVTALPKHKYILKHNHFAPQYEFICLPGDDEIRLNFMGFFENIEDDFEDIKRRLSIDENIQLKNENVTSVEHQDYKEHYTDEMKNIAANLYSKDIDLLGYNFDNSSLPSQLDARK